jgi:hypothetical protein
MKPKDPRLGRVYRGDARNDNYPLRAAIPAGADLRDHSWGLPRSKFLNQGQTPECTGFSAAHDLSAEPVVTSRVDSGLAHMIYLEARREDEWEGEDYEGSSVLGATRALKPLGFTGEYRWAGVGGSDAAEDAALALSHVGPVVFGTDFLDDMFDLAGDVFAVSGDLAGGHAYTARWIAPSKNQQRRRGAVSRSNDVLIGGPNSWGLGWGSRGEWAMWLSDARRLLAGIYSPGEARVSTSPFRRTRR